MDRLTEMEAFVHVVDHGGFTDAARKMGLSKSAVSKHVSALEARLAVRLLNRTTRRVNPTEVGLAYYDRARSVLTEAAEADSMVTAMQANPKGSLRISAPVTFGVHHVTPAVSAFLGAYPEVDVNMVLDDRFVELLAEGFDLAIRIGTLADSSLKAKKLAETRTVIVASPAYVSEASVPRTIDDLNDHRLLHYSQLSTGNFWRLHTASGEERQIRVGGRLTVNNGEALMRAAEAGLGIAQVPSFMLGAALASGRLVELLPDRPRELLGVYAVYPQGRFPQPKLRAFIDFLSDHFRKSGADTWPA
ncbi:DNA-binding transcriptional LysR family regulator [Amaricoccus macauensis]|uniref:DNA-binding transcriptional LysR family regulator n=1 Tax=Amaricoccus macauensis TaxID=57001 RepID=A0A840SKW4_9RHOB|nr:LysR family transcriptional regulator [Amaricoccus macauensis]MBB5222587.1 DNA-binding transcriptional LysR family regulator [Amaricoccus macauensis]